MSTFVEVPGIVGPISGEPRLPCARGPLTEALFERWQDEPGRGGPYPGSGGCDPLADDDFQLALYACYELHYRGFAGVRSDWEWDPGLLGFRAQLEAAFERRLVEGVGTGRAPDDVVAALAEVVALAGGPSLSSYAAESATADQFRELCIHRSAYQRKEADPHTWAIPRLWGTPKGAMVAIQADEYGQGVPGEAHAELFADTMVCLDLDPTYGAYLDRLPGTTLATVNLISYFGLHRRHRGAAVGHLAVFEMTSVAPMRRYSSGLERLGVGPLGRRFYDVHVEADEVHEVIAAERLVQGLVADQPELAADVLFGARTLMMVEESFAVQVMSAWSNGLSSLLPRPAVPENETA